MTRIIYRAGLLHLIIFITSGRGPWIWDANNRTHARVIAQRLGWQGHWRAKTQPDLVRQESGMIGCSFIEIYNKPILYPIVLVFCLFKYVYTLYPSYSHDSPWYIVSYNTPEYVYIHIYNHIYIHTHPSFVFLFLLRCVNMPSRWLFSMDITLSYNDVPRQPVSSGRSMVPAKISDLNYVLNLLNGLAHFETKSNRSTNWSTQFLYSWINLH